MYLFFNVAHKSMINILRKLDCNIERYYFKLVQINSESKFINWFKCKGKEIFIIYFIRSLVSKTRI